MLDYRGNKEEESKLLSTLLFSSMMQSVVYFGMYLIITSVVIGGTSAEKTMLTVKLASTKYYDNLPTTGDETGRAFRDVELENKLLELANNIAWRTVRGKYLGLTTFA